MSGADPNLDALNRILAGRDCAGPTPDDVISAAEAALGVNFPASYRVFLLHFGAGALPAPYDLHGLPTCRASDAAPPAWSHLLDVDAQLRRYGDHPQTFLPIASDGCGVTIFLDVSRMTGSNECPVVARGPGFDDVDIAPSFLAFAEAAMSGDPLAVI